MDGNTFHKCKIIEILIEQWLWSPDNMCMCIIAITTDIESPIPYQYQTFEQNKLYSLLVNTFQNTKLKKKTSTTKTRVFFLSLSPSPFSAPIKFDDCYKIMNTYTFTIQHFNKP